MPAYSCKHTCRFGMLYHKLQTSQYETNMSGFMPNMALICSFMRSLNVCFP